MIKLRSMVVSKDKTQANSTSANDQRITSIGHFIRRFKLDEIMQMWNVFKGDMSFVGPRPQVEVDASLYTEAEYKMLTIRPGITDIASIVFSDEGDILAGSASPDLKYNQIIRPWKSRLALLYVEHQSFSLDLRLVWLTILAIISRENRELKRANEILKSAAAFFGAELDRRPKR